ncbi:MAG: hypothetical protein ABI946_05235 [Chthoniobacterales bacterium]
MKIIRLSVIGLSTFLTISCSEKTTHTAAAPERENSEAERESAAGGGKPNAEADEGKERAPEPEEIGEDCVAFLRSTKAALPNQVNKDCPQCPSDAAIEVLKFDDFHVDRVTPGEASCEVAVTIKGQFNPSSGGEIVGGLTGWITPEQKAQYRRGETPTGQEVYRVKIIYQRIRGAWRAAEFDRTGTE